MKKIITTIFIVLYIAVITFMSAMLLNYNEHRVTEMFGKTFLIMDEKVLDFSKNSLLLVSETPKEKIEAGDYIFYYDTSTTKSEVMMGQIDSIYEVIDGDISYYMPDGTILSAEYVIGTTNDTQEIKYAGIAMNILENKWGFLILIIVPAAIIFLYQLINMIFEIKVYSAQLRKNNY